MVDTPKVVFDIDVHHVVVALVGRHANGRRYQRLLWEYRPSPPGGGGESAGVGPASAQADSGVAKGWGAGGGATRGDGEGHAARRGHFPAALEHLSPRIGPGVAAE